MITALLCTTYLHSYLLLCIKMSEYIRPHICLLVPTSLFAGVSVLFSFVVLSFVAHLDKGVSQIFVGPETKRRCEDDLAEKGLVKIHWLWNRAIAVLLATLGSISVLRAEQLMASAFVRGLRANFFLYPWAGADQVQTRGSGSAEACNKISPL